MTSESVGRREFLARLAVLPIASGIAVAQQAPRPTMTVYKSPTCTCCSKWVAHVRKAGFTVVTKDLDDLDAIKKDLGVPGALGSCHTGVVGAYVIEGHVPADLIDKLLAEKPRARGLTIPGMPASAPGMDVPGQPYAVLLFTAEGKTSVYARR